jgi:hypothetical protein
VLGLLIGAIAFGISLVRDRLYSQDLSDLEFVANRLTSTGPLIPVPPPEAEKEKKEGEGEKKDEEAAKKDGEPETKDEEAAKKDGEPAPDTAKSEKEAPTS